MTNSLQTAVAALKCGDKEQAYLLLSHIVSTQPHNITAWLWLSGAVNTDVERRHCLEHVLALDPANAAAQRGLAQLPQPDATGSHTAPAQPLVTQRSLLPALPSAPGQITALRTGETTPLTTLPASIPEISQSRQVSAAPAGRPRPARKSHAKRWLRIIASTMLAFCTIGLVGLGAITFFGQQANESVSAITQPPPNWKKFQSNQAKLWLPASFVGGDLAMNKATVIGEIRALGPEYQHVAQTAEQSSSVDMWMVDGYAGPSYSINVNVDREYVPAELTVDEYLDQVVADDTNQMQLISRQVTTRGSQPQGRLVLEMQNSGSKARVVTYVIKSGRSCWIISFGTNVANYSRALSIAEQSIRTFAVEP